MFEKMIKAAFFLLIGLFLALYLHFAFSLMKYPYDWDISEGTYVYYAERILEGSPLYTDNNSFPALACTNPPLYPAAIALSVKLFGASKSLLCARAISLTCGILTAVIIFLIARKETRSVFLSFASASFYFLFFPASKEMSLAGPLPMGVFFSLLGVFLIYRGKESKIFRFLGGLSLLLALHTHVMTIFAALCVCVYLTLDDRKKGLRFTALLSLCVAALFIIINHATGGLYYRNLVLNIIPGSINLNGLYSFHTLILSNYFLLATSAILYSALSIHNKEKHIWVFYFLAAVIAEVVAGAGSTPHRTFLPAVSAICILFGLGVNHLRRSLGKEVDVRLILPAAIVFLVQFILIIPTGSFIMTPEEGNSANWDKVVRYAQGSKGNVLFEMMPMAMINSGKEQYFLNMPVLARLNSSGKWNADFVISVINSRKFDKIFSYDRGDFAQSLKGINEAMDENYFKLESIPISTLSLPEPSAINIYVPRK